MKPLPGLFAGTTLASGLGGVTFKLALALALVLGLIFVLQRVARRWGASFAPGGGRNERIRILSRLAVGPRLSLAVIQVLDRTLLVGISPQGIRRVAELGRWTDAPPAPVSAGDAGAGEAGGGEAGFEAEFRDRLSTLRGRYATVSDLDSPHRGTDR